MNQNRFKRVYIEITNHCNLTCPFCVSKKNKDFINLDNFKNIIVQIKKYSSYVYLHVLGEPTSHPNFEDFLNIIDEENMNLQLVTNGTLLYKHQDILKHKCLRKLSISIHSIDKVNIKDKYFETINKFINDFSLQDKAKLELRFYDKNNLNGNSLKYIKQLKDNYNIIDTNKKDSYKLTNNVYLYHQTLFKWPNIKDKTIGNIGFCHGGKDMLAILVNGDVTICCLDAFGHTKIGNIYEDNMEDILKNDDYLKHINELKNHRLSFELCKKCTYRLRFNKF